MFSEKIPGENVARLAFCGRETRPPAVAVTGACVWPADSHGICRFAWLQEVIYKGEPTFPTWKLVPPRVADRGNAVAEVREEARLLPKTAAMLPAATVGAQLAAL